MPLQAIVILGSSASGLSLALACAGAGLAVTICEPDPHARERAQVFMRSDAADLVEHIVFADKFEEAGSASFVFDALDAEDRDRWSDELDGNGVFATPHDAPLAAAPAERSLRFVPFQPMQLRHLTEISGFSETSDEALTAAHSLATTIGRVPVTLPRGTRSVGLRLLDRLHEAADALLLDGAILWELDEAMTDFGFDLGFYEAQDLTGLDVAYARRKARMRPSKIADRAVEEGRIGKKIGWGWYRYPGGGGAVIDPLIEDLIREEAWFAKVTQRSFSSAETMQVILSALRAEASDIVRENQLNAAEDLGRIPVHGLGYPKAKTALVIPA